MAATGFQPKGSEIFREKNFFRKGTKYKEGGSKLKKRGTQLKKRETKLKKKVIIQVMKI